MSKGKRIKVAVLTSTVPFDIVFVVSTLLSDVAAEVVACLEALFSVIDLDCVILILEALRCLPVLN